MNTVSLASLTSIARLSAHELSELLAFLVDHERAPGGPYLFSQSPAENVALNLKIYTLFFQAGKPLPKTYEYVSNSSELLNSEQYTLFKRLGKEKTPHFAAGMQTNSPFDTSLIEKQLSPELFNEITPVLNKLLAVDKYGEITQLLSLFVGSFPKQKPPSLPRLHYEKIGHANFYTWVTYTLYDSILDEHPSPLLLPAANCMHRMAVAGYIESGVPASLIHKEFTKVDSANALELLYCRFTVSDKSIDIQQLPQKKVLIQLLSGRSSVHYLGLLAFYSHFTTRQVAPARFTQLLNYYLAARQLSDDIHDWEEDFEAGRITYVVAHLLQKARITKGTHRIEPLKSRLKKLFWESEMSVLLNFCLKMARDAKDGYINELGMSMNAPFTRSTIDPIIAACQSALDQQAFSKTFIEIQRDKN